ncbi:intermembrane lipid transfer protein VPS13B isoform X1 [Tribolium castaneum]|uniref:intermembrane lipid transfer protein VPS13B isoform X1 n=1 Tax=Tribolium castaneum TaxID=7070 RepID=UPI00046C2B43|nr:PREDICTED: vacuolar protein sorting-associated protein 13B isoform X1 [Tribolium castaneum]XP_015839071.1 PREDICTED: vacuolar protein sorting-associated protein 13B isoform X1 [Tribolium castaneum]XP_015839072.1 PREDICTED: vacuolar protein sorting-associated protein 13B isoform X1 [Tribolium castaneum]|eukprot:XP_008197902.1 PREDICTED: vacuolar protein sorting-associated protein 13B isoform X1 [Tribolium castaneum]
MFKLESYIAPILLSYVDKYIKNFRLEDSQVSLWGGDASFHNLDLRLEVLEQELQSPFSFISGHIRELLIHVPWTKLTSEPITITINTIECVLKLKDANSSVASDASPTRDTHKKSSGHRQEVEAPPNYVQLLINKIVSNIRIFCNNLILKYVEEDIVLSMNVKHLKVESCNEKWEAAYTDISPTQVIMRKVIGVNDLTVCLDKRNASGKIDFYQEPMLYRCSMTMHLLRTYHSSTSNKTSLTRLDVYCNNMEFSMTEQQVPMFLRLLVLLSALQQKQLKSNGDAQENSAQTQESKDSGGNTETWTGWAWSYVSSVLPTQWDENLENQQFLNQSGHIIQIGFYVDNASLTFKVSETSHDKGYYSQKKIRYYSLLTFQLQGIYSELVSVGRKWSNVMFGVSEIMLLPVGPCSCAHPESAEGLFPYLAIGSQSSNHKSNSLFDAQAVENQGQYRSYDTNWEFHMFTNTDAVLLERTPAFACDYLYQMEIPDDASSDILSDLGSNLEYSNLTEKASVRVFIGPLKFRVCSGFFHRTSSLQVAASMYDYPPYYVPKPEPMLTELLPPSEEDFDALNEFIPTRSVKIMLFEPVVELQFMDHPFFEPAKGTLFKKMKKHSTALPVIQLHKLPKVTIECKLIEICLSNPMYVNRLVHTTCQLPEPPQKMFEACFTKLDVNIVGLCSRLVLKQNNYTTLVVPFNLSYQSRSILSPQYWINSDVMHSEINFQSESLTFNCTKAKLIVVSHLINNIFKKDTTGLKSLRYTSLLYDASKDYAMPYLELSVEGLRFKKVCTNSTVSIDLALESIKAFIFESNENDSKKINSVSDIQQVLFLSGPEPKSTKKTSISEDLPLFMATIQYPLKPELQTHPSLVIFNLQEINVCVDPLVCKWLLYHPIKIGAHRSEERVHYKSLSYSEVYGSTSETPRRSAQIGSIHSSSDRDIVYTPQQKLPMIEEEEQVDLQEQIYEFLKTWHPVWKSMLLSGHISQCIIYFPMASISAVGSQGVEEAIREALNKKLVPNVMVITLPYANIHSAQKQNVVKYLKKLPVKLPETVWNADRSSFPWTMSISDLNCYSMENGKEVAFLKTVRINATVGLSTKPVITDGKTPDYTPAETTLGSLGVYVHIDVTPIIISVSEAQMYLLASLIYGLTEFFNSLVPKKTIEVQKQPDLPSIITVASPSLSPTVKDQTLESSGTIPGPDSSDTNENVKLTAWIQWTVTKFSIELLAHETSDCQLKLVIDVEDIVSSLDYQNVYLKMKSKIGSISVQHYRKFQGRSKWQRGPFSGVVVRLREDVFEKRPEESGFIGMTITRASSQHTHNLWGTVQKTKKPNLTTSRYITEIVISVQPIDVVVSIKTLMGFYSIIAPFLEGFDEASVTEVPPKNKPTFTNQALPLAYLECHDIRLLVPSSELTGGGNHDVFVVQVEKIGLSPTVPNPICRTPIRPDIYRQAAQARVLTIPGSELEDRQYQLDVTGMSVSSTSWKDLEQVLNMRGNSRGINENPALEWNNLKQGKLSIVPILNLKQVVEKFDISVVAAPTMVYKNEIIVCSSSFEINFVTDIAVFVSLDHLKLVSALINELKFPVSGSLVKERMEITYPYTRFDIFKDDLETELTEFYKDSGIDTSEIRSVLSSKSPVQPTRDKHKISVPSQNFDETPSEILFTAGKISCCLYQFSFTQSHQGSHRTKKPKYADEEDRNYEASEEESVDEAIRSHKKYTPLLYFFVSQPNIYSSKQQFANNIHLSCFDVGIKLNDSKNVPISSVPTVQDFPVDLVVTRSGHPDPATGIPPAFFTMKYTKEHGKMANFVIDVARPTKLACSPAKITSLLTLKHKIMENFPMVGEVQDVEPDVGWFRRIRDNLKGIDTVQFKTDQLVVVVETEHNLDATLTINKSKNRLFLSERPEKIQSFTTLECMTLTVTSNNVKRLLLNPWTVSFEFGALVESWQRDDSEPQIHVTIDSDCLLVDISPEQIICMEKIMKELSEFNVTPSVPSEPKIIIPEKDQHYKDDLRAGAFQFIEASSANSEELPLPYQVMFWNFKETSAMAWRYPQPRALTKVRIFPVPLEISIDPEPTQVTCSLQYWSDYHCSYIPYAQFSLSESEVCYLDLPKSEPQRAVAYIWRVVLTSLDSNGAKINRSVISPRALAACMRIDSYFNKAIVPNFTTVLYVSKLELSLVNHFDKDKSVVPITLRHFTPDQAIPANHTFLKVTSTNLRLHMAHWDSDMLYCDLTSHLRCSSIDYTFLTEQTLIDQFTFKVELNLAKKLTLGLVSNPIRVIFGPTIAHTLTVNSQLWAQKSLESDHNMVIFTRYVVCNDTNMNLRFGQVGTDEDILLPSRSFHLYCWRSAKNKRKLKVAFEERGWLWSKPFRIDEEGTHFVALSLENNLNVIVTIKALSTSQKQVTIGGQFVIANMLLEHFEFKIIPESRDDKELKRAPVHVLGGKTITPSMFIDSRLNYFFRLRFYGLESAWTGDIPLKEHTKGAQPWLVKVPLQERGQFLSIWCRIVVQDCQKGKRILAMLWPLFMVKSNLPITSNIHIETPTLNVHLDSSVRGKGELQQLYCPGTIDHSHQLTFKLHDGTSISDPYIPLNYSLVDQQKFFKKADKENIDDILDSLRNFDVSQWPYFGEDLENVEWVVEEQPQTTIQVRYQNACQYSSALSVELLPWCLMVNTFGCPVSLFMNGTELCRIPQYGIVAPPKLDDNFHLGVDTGGGLSYSPPLQLSTSDWSQTFYMPKISGTLPPEGSIKTSVKCGSDVAMVSLTSVISDQIRLLKISSSHVFSNYLLNQIQVVCFAVPDCDRMFNVPANVEKLSFSVAPQLDKTNSGISIIRWYALEAENSDASTNYAFYVAFSMQYEFGWSCPVRVDDNVSRRSLSVRTSRNKWIPLVLTSQERKGQIYLSLFHDDSPQTLIENKSSVNLYCGQAIGEGGAAIPESRHFKWFSKLECGSSVYYTMPFVSEKFPELPQTCFSEKIVFAIGPKTESDHFEWSSAVSIVNDSEQFVKIPNFGDVKLVVKVTSYTTLLSIESVSGVEINAIDIRGRLSRHEMETVLGKYDNRHKDIVADNNFQNAAKILPKLSLYQSLFKPTLQNNWDSIEVFAFVKSFSLVFLADHGNDSEKEGVASFSFDDVGVELRQSDDLKVSLSVLDIQFDNELYSKESFDFPVVVVSQDQKPKSGANVLEKNAKELIRNTDSVLILDMVVETWFDDLRKKNVTGVKEVKVKLNSLSIYVEDLYINKLMEYFTQLFPMRLAVGAKPESRTTSKSVSVRVPELVFWNSLVIAKPLSLKTITVEPLSLLLSVHCSLKMYIALDQSPLQFARFERRRLLTTPYRLGHAMTMHYLSGAIFGAGWVVSSLELLGSPSGLARAMGIGLRDFINLPYRGLIQGPWAFLTGVTHGSASLMKHVTAGTLQSVTKLASSVARNLDRLTLDEEHLRRTEEQRRQKPQGVTQGFMQGLTGLGISLLGAVGGIAHHPLQSIMADGASPRSLAAGVGLGLVGVLTKPLSGAAELVALTGQGLLQGAGWNPLPQPRSDLVKNLNLLDSNSMLKYEWKLLSSLTYKNVLFATEATMFNDSEFKGIGLVLAPDALIIVNLDDDNVKRIISLGQIQVVASDNDPTYLSFRIMKQKCEEECVVEMDPASRARVADYVRSTASLLQLPEVNQHSVIMDDTNEQINCYVNPQNRNYFVCLLTLAKQMNSNYNFPVL